MLVFLFSLIDDFVSNSFCDFNTQISWKIFLLLWLVCSSLPTKSGRKKPSEWWFHCFLRLIKMIYITLILTIVSLCKFRAEVRNIMEVSAQGSSKTAIKISYRHSCWVIYATLNENFPEHESWMSYMISRTTSKFLNFVSVFKMSTALLKIKIFFCSNKLSRHVTCGPVAVAGTN